MEEVGLAEEVGHAEREVGLRSDVGVLFGGTDGWWRALDVRVQPLLEETTIAHLAGY